MSVALSQAVRCEPGRAASDMADWMARRLAQMESFLDDRLPVDAPAGLGDAMRYAVLDGGKRLRPLQIGRASCRERV